MRVRAVKSFAGLFGSYTEGDVFDLPEGTDWLKAGLVEPVEEEKPAIKATPKAETSEVKTAKRKPKK